MNDAHVHDRLSMILNESYMFIRPLKCIEAAHLLQMKAVNHIYCSHLGLIIGGRCDGADGVPTNHKRKNCSCSSSYMR